MTRTFLVLVPLVALVLQPAGGCARYEPLPLTADKVDAALTLNPQDLARLKPWGSEAGDTRPTVTVDLDDGLSPDEAAAIAVTLHPALRADRDRLAVNSAQLLQAGLLPNPQLSANVDPVVGGNTTGTMTGYGAGLNWEITALIARDAKIAAASAGIASVRLDVAWKEWQAAQAARVAVFDLLALDEQTALAQEVFDRLNENLTVIRSATDRGLKTIVDLGAAETARHDARAVLLSQQRDVARQTIALTRAVGLPATQPVRAQRGMRLPSRLDLPSQDDFLRGLEDRRLDLVALRRGYESQESTLHAAVLAQFPKISIGFTPASDTTNVHTFGFGVTIDVPLFDRNQGVIATESATRRQLYDEYVSRVFEARADVATALADIHAINAAIAAAEEAIPSLQRLVDAYRQASDARNADVLSYYAVRNDLAQKRIDLVKLKQQLVQNGVALELASGRRLQGLASENARHPHAATTTTTAPAVDSAEVHP